MPGESFVNCYLDGSRLVAFQRAEDGSLKRRIVPAEYVAYFRQSELPQGRLDQLRRSPRVIGLRAEGEWFRVRFADRDAREGLVLDPESPLVREGIPSYEGDVHPVARWIIDEGVQLQRPRRVHLDIETDPKRTFAEAVEGYTRIFSIALAAPDGFRKKLLLTQDTDAAERRLLEEFWRLVEPWDQLAAWNGDGFDFPVIRMRTQFLRIRAEMRRLLYVDQMAVFERNNMHAAEDGEEKRSMALDSIGKSVTGRGKLEVPEWAKDVTGRRGFGECVRDLWEKGGNYRELVGDYNMQDTELLLAIEEKRPYLSLFDTVCQACRIFGDTRALHPTAQMDGYMLRKGAAQGIHWPTREHREKGDKIKGALVLKPRISGIGRNVHVYDFKSLYPLVMLSFNMSPETKDADAPREGPIREGCCRSPDGVTFRTDKVGLLIEALEELLAMRAEWKKKEKSCGALTPEWNYAHQMSTAYKVIANGMYGVLSSIWSRFFDPVIGEAITQTAKWLNVKTLEAAEKEWFPARKIPCRAVYADTDSGYLLGPDAASMREFRTWCNKELYPRLLREQGCKRCLIEIAYEKEYRRIVFNGSAKKLGELCAKQYAGMWEHYEGNPWSPETAPEIKGLACVRGDATRLAAQLQKETIDLLVGGLQLAKDGPVPTDDLSRYRSLIERHRKAILEGPLVIDDIEKSQALDRPLNGYAVRRRADGEETVPAHVAVAKILLARGMEVREGTRIRYVVLDGSCSPMKVIPSEDYDGTNVDRWHIWEKQVYPPTRHLLEGAFPPIDERGRPNPDHDWSKYAKVRPRPDRHVLPGQMGLFGDTRVSPVAEEEPEEESELMEIHVRAEVDPWALLELEAELRSSSGDDRVDLILWEGEGPDREQVVSATFMVDMEILGDVLREVCDRAGAKCYAA